MVGGATDSALGEFRQALSELFRSVLTRFQGARLGVWEWLPTQELRRGESPGSWHGEQVLRRIVSPTTVAAVAVAARHDAAPLLLPVIATNDRLRQVILGDVDPSNPDHVGSVLHNQLLGVFASRYLERLTDQVGWDEDAFVATADELMSYIQRDADTVICTATLNRFSMDQDMLEIRPDLWFERFTWEERQRKFEEMSSFPAAGWDQFAIADVEFVFRTRQFLERGSGDRFAVMRKGQDLRTSVLRALRLTGPGRISSHMQWWTVVEPCFNILAASLGTQWSNRPPGNGSTMDLTVQSDTAAAFANLLDRLSEHPIDGALDVAIRRLEYAYERSRTEDRMIDYWIGLEALFMSSGDQGEQTDKLSRRIARLLGQDLVERRTLRSSVKRLYGTRSRLVHGVEPDRGQTAVHTEQSGTLLRRSIVRRLVEGWDVQQLEDQMMQ